MELAILLLSILSRDPFLCRLGVIDEARVLAKSLHSFYCASFLTVRCTARLLECVLTAFFSLLFFTVVLLLRLNEISAVEELNYRTIFVFCFSLDSFSAGWKAF